MPGETREEAEVRYSSWNNALTTCVPFARAHTLAIFLNFSPKQTNN